MKDIKLLGTRTGQFYGDFNDISYDGSGNIVMVEGTPLARQAITKILLTALNSRPFYDYGTLLSSYVPTNAEFETLKSQITNTILFALTFYNQIQVGALPSELINQINDIQVTMEGVDTVAIKIDLLMQDGTTLIIPLGV